MPRGFRKIIRRVSAALLIGSTSLGAEAPFWRTKEKFATRVAAGEPVVSVSSVKLEGARRRLNIIGGGRVPRSLDATFGFARQLDRVARLSGYVERAEMNDARDRLHLTFAALGKRAEFDLRVEAEPERHRLTFEILGGPLKGLVAHLDFAEVRPRVTEVGIDGHYEYETFPFKGAILSLGLETVFKTMAERLRDGATKAVMPVDNPADAVKDSAARAEEN